MAADSTEPDGIAPARRPYILAACVLASAMAFIDGSALTVALPQLRASLGAELSAVQWVLNGYALALASLTLIGGALADSYGKARMLALGCVLFAASSVACALAPDVGWLIAARVVQGTAAALLTPASLALLGATYPRAQRNAAVGIWAAASAITTAAGPVLGGWLVETQGWEAVFWINPPLAAGALTLLLLCAPRDRREPRPFDLPGAAILAAALAAIAWALGAIGPRQGGGNVEVALLVTVAAAGLAGLGLFAWWERRTPNAMTPPRLAANRAFVGLNAATLAIYTGLSLMFFLLSFELIDRRGVPATTAGLVFLPFSLALGVLSRLFGKVADKFGSRRLLIVGPLGAAAGYVWMALAQDASLVAGVIAPVGLIGISFAILITPLTASVLSSVVRADEGLASGTNNAAARIAQLAGVALAAGLAAYPGGFMAGLFAAALCSLIGAGIMAASLRDLPAEAGQPGLSRRPHE